LKKFNPYSTKLKYFTANQIRKALLREIKAHKLDWCFYVLLEESFKKKWKYNGANVVNDKYYPNLYSWLHDYMWTTGAGGYRSDVILRYLEEVTYSYSKASALIKFRGVRVGWETPLIGYKANHKRKGNIRELTEAENKCYQVAKNYYI
jgi:hypothetical protein